jgi:hypothetical protein
MIGVERAGALDARFGSLQPPRNLDTDGIKSWEREAPENENELGRPLTHRNRLFAPDADGHFPSLSEGTLKDSVDLDALKSGQKHYMWSVSALGRLIIGEEFPVETKTEGVRHLGHPTLVGGGNARISGELRYNRDTQKFVVSNRSGRYSRYEDRSLDGLDAAIAMFKDMGLDVERDQVQKYITEKKPEKLVLPSLDRRRHAGPSTKD